MILIVNEPAALKSLEAKMPDVVIVNTNYVSDPPTGRRGLALALALEHASAGRPVIVTSLLYRDDLNHDPLFVSLMEKPNVVFLPLPASKGDYYRAYQSLGQRMAIETCNWMIRKMKEAAR